MAPGLTTRPSTRNPRHILGMNRRAAGRSARHSEPPQSHVGRTWSYQYILHSFANNCYHRTYFRFVHSTLVRAPRRQFHHVLVRRRAVLPYRQGQQPAFDAFFPREAPCVTGNVLRATCEKCMSAAPRRRGPCPACGLVRCRCSLLGLSMQIHFVLTDTLIGEELCRGPSDQGIHYQYQ